MGTHTYAHEFTVYIDNRNSLLYLKEVKMFLRSLMYHGYNDKEVCYTWIEKMKECIYKKNKS